MRNTEQRVNMERGPMLSGSKGIEIGGLVLRYGQILLEVRVNTIVDAVKPARLECSGSMP